MPEIPSDFLEGFDTPSLDQWRANVTKDLKGADFARRLVTRTPEGIEVQPLYTRASVAALPEPGLPGAAPFTRGGCTSNGWQTRQEFSEASIEGTRVAVEQDLARGANACTLVLDRAFRLGSDADAALADLGVGGVSVATAYELARALSGVEWATHHVALEAGGNGLAALSMLLAVAQRARVSSAAVHASIITDPIAALSRDGALSGSVDGVYRELAASIGWCATNAPHIRTLAVDTRTYEDGGADAATALGLGIATAIDTARRLAAEGVAADQISRACEWHTSVGRDLFMEVAKIRATRMLWHRVMELLGAGDSAAALHVHAATSRRTLTRRDPYVNMLRGTSATFAAIVAGADSIATRPFDEAVGVPNPLARRVARNTQLVLQMESHLDAVSDPAGGSWYVESLTHDLAQRAWAVMQEIETAGGMLRSTSNGSIAQRVAACAEKAERDLRRRRIEVTGVSTFANPSEQPLARARGLDAAFATSRSAAVTAGRERAQVRDELRVLREAAGEPTAGLAAAAIAAAAAGATVGQLHDATADRSTGASHAPTIPLRREASEFEAIADAVAAHAGADAAVFLATVGPLPKHKARAAWTEHLLHAGGLETRSSGASGDVAEAVAAFAASGARAAVIVAHDELYPDIIPTLAPALRDAGAVRVLAAGRLDDGLAAHVDECIFVGCDVVDVLETTLAALEVKR